jgi:hypothetical protein
MVMSCHPRIAPHIAPWPVAHVMAYAVELNRKTRLRTIEIKHVRTDRVLSAKYRLSRRTLAQPAPQPGFWN